MCVHYVCVGVDGGVSVCVECGSEELGEGVGEGEREREREREVTLHNDCTL